METSIFFGGSAIAAFVAGLIALFAPCCISVMLPAYFASSFRNRGVLVAMTILFAAGIGTVILPLAMGAAILRQLFVTQHSVIYTAGGVLMLAMAVYTLLGGQLHLPMPGRRAGGKTGAASVYGLGIFSGIASSCCAPVLAGVIALARVAQSFSAALGLGTAYVFGMVAPLFLMSLHWDRFDWRSGWLFRRRHYTWRVWRIQRPISGTALASGILLALMGIATMWIGLAYSSMPPTSDWQVEVAVRLQHIGRIAIDLLAWLPNWAAAVALLAFAGLLGRRALRQVRPNAPDLDLIDHYSSRSQGEHREDQ